MALIQSNKCVFQLDRDGTYVTVMCLRSFQVNTITSEKEITTPSDGRFKDFDYKQLSARASLDGVLFRDLTTNTLFDFAEAQLNFIEVPVRAIYEDENGDTKVFRGTAIVMDSTLDASAGQVGAGTVELLFKGAYYIENFVPEYINLRLIITGNPTAQAFLKLWLINSDGEAVFQTDILDQASGGQLSNPIDITVPALKGSWSYWFQVITNSVGNTFALNAPPTANVSFQNGTTQQSSVGVQEYDFTADRTVTVTLGVANPNPGCVSPSVPGSPTLPDATVGVPYTASFALAGSDPFNITNVVKPAWLNINLYQPGGAGTTVYVMLQGTPDTAGAGVTVSFDINNACGSVAFSDTIDVAAPPVVTLMKWEFREDGGIGTLRVFRNSIMIVEITDESEGQFAIDGGDVIEVQVLAGSLYDKHLFVLNETDDILLHDTTSLLNRIYSFTAAAGKTYYALGEV
jgi:hypothetical protein